VVLPHGAGGSSRDAHSDRVVVGVGDAALPGARTLILGKDGGVGALAELRAGAWRKRGTFDIKTESRLGTCRTLLHRLKSAQRLLVNPVRDFMTQHTIIT